MSFNDLFAKKKRGETQFVKTNEGLIRSQDWYFSSISELNSFNFEEEDQPFMPFHNVGGHQHRRPFCFLLEKLGAVTICTPKSSKSHNNGFGRPESPGRSIFLTH